MLPSIFRILYFGLQRHVQPAGKAKDVGRQQPDWGAGAAAAALLQSHEVNISCYLRTKSSDFLVPRENTKVLFLFFGRS